MGGGQWFPHENSTETHLEDQSSNNLYAVVDIGSNGIRFSISDLSPPTGRIIPTVHSHRVGISLYDAQYDTKTGSKIPVSQSVIRSIIGAILRFQATCVQFGVPSNRIRIVATEATRTAINSAEIVASIEKTTGYKVELLEKAREGLLGAWGIASGYSDIEGLAMDLGGGSTQITWVVSHGAELHISPQGSVSFPYGAGALSRTLAELKKGKSKKEANRAVERLRQEMDNNFRDAYNKLEIPERLAEEAKKNGGFRMYISGGGFRGWGYLLLYLHQTKGRHYPISIINGYRAESDEFAKTETLKEIARTSDRIFRVSDRRRKQVPAVAFLVNVLAESLPHGIKEVYFCQGGVREGILFQQLLPVIRLQDPLEVATTPLRTRSADSIGDMLLGAIPTSSAGNRLSIPSTLNVHVIQAFANSMYAHAGISKELASTVALYSTSTGILAQAHGISHGDRTRLALMLQERYGSHLPPREEKAKSAFQDLLSAQEVWWIRYIGKLGLVLGILFPTGIIDSFWPRVLLSVQWASNLGKRQNKFGIELTFTVHATSDHMAIKEILERAKGKIEKVGKKKNRIGGKAGWGVKIKVIINIT
ncbi:putative transcription regulator [Talaromyces proteolyticus]|uniref:Transcription regulator n=1 Tax=Talaromyces proteolyticus TaxID=1131652 RepID=A0AAD4KSL6_9EURO|nr:putative transcription regulator [Talaromyces proteolyticus]KAH8698408.1 putative transcription regulator [Talaromyces proteolyticus]